jgi:rSAM/selenodomain-associated transferase 1
MTGAGRRREAPQGRVREARLLVVAKEPVPGRVKTRLCPPCTHEQAARLALAALRDTLAACDLAAGSARRVLVLDGRRGPWLPSGWEVVPQRGAGLAERLAAAFEDAGGPALLVGMDTPQVSPALLAAGLAGLGEHAAVFGPASDGGYWAIGLREPDLRVFARVPMSRVYTGAIQRARLAALGLRTLDLPPLRDVDDIAAARAVAAGAPGTRFAAALEEIEPRVAAA